MLAVPDLAELIQRIVKLAQFGVIEEIQYEPLRYKVRFDDVRRSHWLQHGVIRGHAASQWDPYETGEAVLCILPEGARDGVVICALYSTDWPQNSSQPGLWRRNMDDGAVIEYDSGTSHLKATLPDGGKVTVEAPGGFRFVGDMDIDGKVKTTGNIQSEAEVSDKTGTMQTMRNQYNGHKHGPTPPPAPQQG